MAAAAAGLMRTPVVFDGSTGTGAGAGTTTAVTAAVCFMCLSQAKAGETANVKTVMKASAGRGKRAMMTSARDAMLETIIAQPSRPCTAYRGGFRRAGANWQQDASAGLRRAHPAQDGGGQPELPRI